MRVETTRTLGKKRRRGFGLLTALATSIAVCAIVTSLAAIVFFIAPGNSSVSASFIHPQTGSRPWNEHQRLTILLMGAATASDGTTRTDSMIIASFDPSSRSIDMLSIPGNLWVTIPGYGQAEIAEAYNDGGARLALLTVESVTHVPIPYFALIDPGTARKLIDALGGVSLPNRSATRPRVKPRHLDGAGLLAYLAPRRTQFSGAPAVMRREQKILMMLRTQAIQPEVSFQLPTIVTTLGGAIPSNFPYNEVPDLARLLGSVPPSHVHTAVLRPSNNTVTPYLTSGRQVLLPDWDHIRVLAQRVVPLGPGQRAGKVEVLNGNGVQGQAASLARWLTQDRIRISGYDSADSFGYAHTEVVMNTAVAHDEQLARTMAALLQAPLVSAAVPKSRAPVVVIIGHDFQDPTQQ